MNPSTRRVHIQSINQYHDGHANFIIHEYIAGNMRLIPIEFFIGLWNCIEEGMPNQVFCLGIDAIIMKQGHHKFVIIHANKNGIDWPVAIVHSLEGIKNGLHDPGLNSLHTGGHCALASNISTEWPTALEKIVPYSVKDMQIQKEIEDQHTNCTLMLTSPIGMQRTAPKAQQITFAKFVTSIKYVLIPYEKACSP